MTIRSLICVAVLAMGVALSAEQTSMSVAGRWTPRDSAKAERLFAVGLSDITRAGMRIEDRDDSLTITRIESDDALARMQQINGGFEAQSVYTLDRSRSTAGTKYFTSRSGSATWDGRQLAIEIVHASEVIGMHEKAAQAVRSKRDSSARQVSLAQFSVR